VSAPLITIFVRHTPGCKHAGDEFTKRCQCRKHLRWTQNGTQHRRATGSRSWQEAETAKRQAEDQLSGAPVQPQKELPKSVDEAVRVFCQDKTVQGVSGSVLACYVRELKRLQTYCERAGVFTVQGIDRELMTGYCATWAAVWPSSYTRSKARERLAGFIKFCYDAQWIPRKPALPRINIDSPETLPLTPDEYARVLAAIPGAVTPAEQPRARALMKLMRFSGLSIRDALMLERSEMFLDPRGYHRVVTARQKTGTHVSTPIPPDVADAVLEVANMTANVKYLLWDGSGKPECFSASWSGRVSHLFEAAQIPDVCFMKSHRLRDTFAVELLQKGVPLEEVSKLLGHDSIRTTEKHYAKWVSGRQDRLDALVVGTWGAA
jgi:integrase/recombinase XerD